MGDAELVLRCVALSLASSLDNFMVGMSLGAYGRPLSLRVNVVVSSCNAAGAVLSSEVGAWLGALAPALAGLACAGIFIWLGLEELRSLLQGEPESGLASLAASGVACRLALPMTLNNIAGGVAGGLAGVGPIGMGISGLTASYCSMYAGHAIGWRGAKLFRSADPRLLAAAAFGGLGLSQLTAVGHWAALLLGFGTSAYGLYHAQTWRKFMLTTLQPESKELFDV